MPSKNTPTESKQAPVSLRFSRGQLAKECGVNGETIRYYEKIGLLANPPRSSGGHRLYNQQHLTSLNFIRRCRELGFSLKEIKDLLELIESGTYTCTEVRDRTAMHLAEVEKKLHDLQRMHRTLTEMVSKCDGGQTPDCTIIDALFTH